MIQQQRYLEHHTKSSENILKILKDRKKGWVLIQNIILHKGDLISENHPN